MVQADTEKHEKNSNRDGQKEERPNGLSSSNWLAKPSGLVSISTERYWMLGAGALGRPRGMEWGGRREEGSGWGTHVYLWRIHFDIWQN